MKKILHINATYASGSTGVIVEDIHRLCLSNGIISYVAYASSLQDKEIINGYKIGSILDHKLHSLLSRMHGKQGYFSSGATRKFIKWIISIKPDIIHLHNLHSSFINLNMLLDFIAKKNITTVITLHDCWFYTGGCTHYTHIECYEWKNICNQCPKSRKDFPAVFSYHSSQILEDRKKYFDNIPSLYVVGVSKWITDEARKSILKNKKSTTIYNGIDLNIFKYTFSELKKELKIEDKYVILGPASKWLQPENALLYNKLISKLDNNTVFILLGCPPNICLPNKVIAYPFITCKQELAKLYSIADVFVNCTHEESMSLINVESQACGTPLICYSNTGAKETVNTEFGRLIKTDDIEAMLHAIDEIKSQRMTENKREKLTQWIAERFEKTTNYHKYIDLYNTFMKP